MLRELGSKFGIPSVIEFVAGHGGLIKAVLTTPHGSGEVYLNGAHVTGYQPKNQAPVLFISNKSRWEAGKPIRGGVPICFPWFGPLEGRDTAPAHGFARTSAWEVLETKSNPDGSATVAMGLSQPGDPNSFWPHAFEARYEVTVGATLLLELTITHTGGEPFLFEEALHTYFTVGDVKQLNVTGLAGTHYIDKMQAGRELMEHMAPIRIVAETDRIYLNTTGECVIDDPVLNRQIINTKHHSDTTVLWNPWIAKSKAMPDFGDEEWPGMLCIETCNVGPCAVTLKPGESHTMTAEIKGVVRA